MKPDNTIEWLEWAPAAHSLHLYGEFNDWKRHSHLFEKLEFGRWKLVLKPGADGTPAIKHLQVNYVVFYI